MFDTISDAFDDVSSLTDKMIAVLFPVGLFIAAGFEHSVANMFMIPAAIYTLILATPEMLNNLVDTEILQMKLTWWNFLMKNLITKLLHLRTF